MKSLVLLIAFLAITILSGAQNNYQDVVYLKDGSIIRGFIIEEVPNQSIKIETADKSLFVFQLNEIEKLTKEPKKGISSQSGYRGIVEVGFDLGAGYYGMDRMRLNFINGYQVNSYLSFGVGTGIRRYFDMEATLVPLFAEVRANFIKNTVSPYASLGVGYSFNATYNFDGEGFLFNPNLGISIKVSPESSLQLSVGYELQKMNILTYGIFYSNGMSYPIIEEYTDNSNAVSITMGLSF